jgi:anti-anti-sigma factor
LITDVAEKVDLRTETLIADGQAVVRLHGEVDNVTVRRLDETLRGVEALGVPIVVNLSELSFIDTAGLNRMVVALKRQRNKGADLVLEAPQRQTRRVLEMVGLDKVFVIK